MSLEFRWKKKVLHTGNSDVVPLDRTLKEVTGFKRGDKLIITCSKGKMMIELDKDEKEEN